MGKSISILGCGWLGLPLAKQLYSQGWQVKGSTTSSAKLEVLKNNGLSPFLIDLKDPKTLQSDFFQADYLVINIPPTKVFRQVEAYQPLVRFIEEADLSKLIFVSSTSVYPSKGQIACESDTETIADGINALLDIERLFQRASFQTTIVRFGGLVGGERYPGRFFTSDKAVNGAQQPINLIHLDDCIRLIEAIIEKDCFPGVLNGVADSHPSKEEFYTLAAQLAGREVPTFITDDSMSKLVSNQRSKDLLGFELKHPDLKQMLKDDSLWARR
ncbi:SDR family oxidoreductase [Carboxylicivirga taeanensis]|uniref:SDR family oxidoreductase n=1 Tax=Carboxylicivirga taeanensis TaxID=1416875 RepID=UPI003F6E0C2C